MDSIPVEPFTLMVCLGLYALVCALCFVLLLWRRYILLLLWPIAIYFCGPLMTSTFADAPVLKNYIFADTIIPETLMMVEYFILFVLTDYFLNTSRAIESCFNGKLVQSLAQSPLFMPVYLSISCVAAFLQVETMAQYGSLFSGSYITVSSALIPYWGFLAGLYELLFLCFILFLSSNHKSKLRFLVIAVYVMTAALRVSGGTRLILIKELAVICILLIMRGQMKRSRLVLIASAVLILGSVINYVRANGEIDTKGFGPLYGVIMESGLDALTLNVAYHVQDSGYVAEHADPIDFVEFLVLSSIPSFLRPGINQSDLDNISPYNQAYSQFDTSAPVGGMSGFATLCYLTSYPFISTLVLVLAVSLGFVVTKHGPLKDVVVLVLSISAIHFWRDPIDIAVKNVAQDVVCALTLLYVPAVYRAITGGWLGLGLQNKGISNGVSAGSGGILERIPIPGEK